MMPAPKRSTRATTPKPDDGEQVTAAIRDHVLGRLGRPGPYHYVQVRRLWDDHYRVNVLVGADAHSTTVAHSYFLRADDAGNVQSTTPPLTRRYGS